jgi:hypothetical protein
MTDARYTFAGGEHCLTLAVPDPAPPSGPVALAVVVEGPVLLLVARLGGEHAWRPAAFSWHLLPPGRRVEPAWPLPPGAGVPLRLRLVSAATGAALAERRLDLPPGFATVLHAAIRHQARQPAPTVTAFDRAVDRLLARYSGAGLVKPAIARVTL